MTLNYNIIPTASLSVEQLTVQTKSVITRQMKPK